MAIDKMDNVVVDQSSWTQRIAVSVGPKIELIEGSSQQKRRKADNLLAWTVDTLIFTADGPKALSFTHYGPTPPELPAMSPVDFGKVTAHVWATSQKSGLWFEVESVTVAGASQRRAS